MCTAIVVVGVVAGLIYMHLHKQVLDEIKAKLHDLTGPKQGP